MLAGRSAQSLVERLRLLFSELPDAANPEQLEIPEHSGTDGNQIFELARISLHKTSLTPAYCSTSLI